MPSAMPKTSQTVPSAKDSSAVATMPASGRHHGAPERSFGEQGLAEHLGEGGGGQAEAEPHQNERRAGRIRIVEGAPRGTARRQSVRQATRARRLPAATAAGRDRSRRSANAAWPAARRPGNAPQVPAAARCWQAPPSARAATAPPGRHNRATKRPRARTTPPVCRRARKAAPLRWPRGPEILPAAGLSGRATRPGVRNRSSAGPPRRSATATMASWTIPESVEATASHAAFSARGREERVSIMRSAAMRPPFTAKRRKARGGEALVDIEQRRADRRERDADDGGKSEPRIERHKPDVSGSPASPGARAKARSPAPISTIPVRPSNARAKTVTTSPAMRARASPSRAARAGTRAGLSPPSPTTRRTRLGSRNAARNASATGPAPSACANSTSRTNPRIRDAPAPRPTRREERITDMLSGA